MYQEGQSVVSHSLKLEEFEYEILVRDGAKEETCLTRGQVERSTENL